MLHRVEGGFGMVPVLLSLALLSPGLAWHQPPADGQAPPVTPVSRLEPPAGDAPSSGPAPTGAAPTLRDLIAASGSADAVVFLKMPPAPRRAELRLEVRRAQDEVLRAFAPRDLAGLHRFSMVPALAARVTAEQLARLEASPRVLAVSPNLPGGGALSVSVPLIGADRLHRAGLTGAGVVTAVLDTGLDTDHPDFAGANVGEHCFCQGSVLGDGVGCCPNGLEEQDGPGSAEDDHGHGSSVTSILLSRGSNDLSSAGVAPGAQVVAVKVLDATNSGFLLDWSKGLDWILANRPDVRLVNMSLESAATFTGICDGADAVNMAMGAAVTSLRNVNGATTFAVSGNDGLAGQTTSPGCLAGSVMVGAVYDANIGNLIFGTTCTDATTAPDKVACFSNTDDILDLLGPGCRIASDDPGPSWTAFCGTSQACPHAVGAAALLLEREPALTPADVEARLKSTGAPVFDARVGLSFPRVDAAAAIGPDPDGDGTDDPLDVCGEVYNPSQADADSDGFGDVCDTCPSAASPIQSDADQDGLGDPCDPSPNTFPPETLFVVDPAAGGTIYQLHRGTRTIINSFPTPEPAIGGGSGLAYSTRRASLFYTNGTSAGVPTIYELSPVTGAVLNSFPQTTIDGLTNITGLGGSAGGLLSLSIQDPGNSVLLASPYDGTTFPDGRGFHTGFNLTGRSAEQGAVAGSDFPPSPSDHAAWFSRNSTVGVPAPTVGVNQIQLLDVVGGTMEAFLAPTRCVSPGANGTLATPPSGDDLVVGAEIQTGPNGRCDTLAAAGDDVAGCFDAGPNGVVNTSPVGDDMIAGRVVAPGANAACNTTVPGGDDVPGGILNRKVNGLGATGDVLLASTNDLAHDVVYVLDAFAGSVTSPRSGPAILEIWPDPTPGGLVEAIAAGPTDTDFDGVINVLDNCIAAGNGSQIDADADGVGDACDNCPSSANPGQADLDGDAVGDACDNCIATVNPGQGDADLDGFGDACDCAVQDVQAWALPGEPTNLLASHDRLSGIGTITWSPPLEPGSTTTALRYDTIRSPTPGDFTNGAACVESDDGADTTVSDAVLPPLGTFNLYWIRSENPCGPNPQRIGRPCP